MSVYLRVWDSFRVLFCEYIARRQQAWQVLIGKMQAARFAVQRFTRRAASQLGHIRQMSGAVSHEEEVKQMEFWKKVSIAGTSLCESRVGRWQL